MRLTIEWIRQAHIDYWKKQTRTLRISENKFYKRWHHEIRHGGPAVKIAPGPLPFNPALVTIRNISYILLLMKKLVKFITTLVPLWLSKPVHTSSGRNKTSITQKNPIGCRHQNIAREIFWLHASLPFSASEPVKIFFFFFIQNL